MVHKVYIAGPMTGLPEFNEIISRLSIAGSTPDSVANLLRCAGYNGMTGRAIRQRLNKLEKENAVEKVRRPGIRSACWAPITK